MKHLKFVTTVCCIASYLLCFAQNQTPKLKGEITGKILQAENGTPIEFATVSVFNQTDNTLFTGSISDENGEFSIPVSYGNFKAMIESISFKAKNIDAIIISKKQSIKDLGTIVLDMDIAVLETIEVTAEKKMLQFSLDKKVLNVGKDITIVGGSVIDILDNIPSVVVDPSGKISLRGSQSVKILIDGKPSAMTRANLLKNVQSNLVEQIEIITNPSAKHDAEGLTGIINIVMKKEKRAGLSGSINASVSHPHDYGLGVNLNRRNNKINLFTNVGIRYWERPKSGFQESEFTKEDSTYFVFKERIQTRRSFSTNAHLGFDYFINDKNTLTTSFLYEIGRQPHDASNFYQDFDENKLLEFNELRLNKELELESALEYQVSYEKTFVKKGQKLEAFVKYMDYTENNDSDLSEFQTDANRNPLDNQVLKQRTTVDEKDRSFIFQMDYTQPFKEKGKMEWGLKTAIGQIKNQFIVEQEIEETWSILDGLSNDFSYEEKIYAAYATISDKKGGFSYQLGLRTEVTDLKTTLKQSNETNDRKPFFDLFPSVHLAYKFKKENALQLSYSRRIQRPRFGDLNPFFSYSDDRFIAVGNPDLNPMYTHSFELGHLKSWENTSINSSLYFRKTNDLIEEIVRINEDDVTITRPENLNNEQVYGAEFFMENEVTKWLKFNTSMDLYYAKLDGNTIQNNLLTDYAAWSGRVAAKISLPKSILFQAKYFYRGPQSTIQGTRKANSRCDIGFKKQILKGQGSLSFSYMDVFNTYRFSYENIAEGVRTVGESRPWRPTASLGFRYRWK